MVVEGGVLRLASSIDWLHGQRIREKLSGRAAQWLSLLEVLKVIDSTSDALLATGRTRSVDGVVYLAELQTRGRGRRGRAWLTPLGGNLAMSAGFALQRSLSELGGLSLVVGLAMLDALHELGLTELQVKWPNDLLLAGAKLGGILVELKMPVEAGRGSEAIVGVGINVSLPAGAREAIDQEVTDLATALGNPDRNRLASRLLGYMVDYIKVFDEQGFAPMRAQYDAHHWLHGRHCQVVLGSDTIAGRVLGVTDEGELRLETSAGVASLRAGEVSVRPAPA